MSTRVLAWYLSGMSSLTCVLFSLITVVPGAESQRTVVQVISAAGAVLFAILGITCGRLSAQHQVNRSGLLRGVMVILAIGVTVFVLVGVIG